MANQEMKQEQKEEDYGVLLYYKYATIPDLEALFNFYESNCKSLSLLGRVRLSHNGVNVTVTSFSFPHFSSFKWNMETPFVQDCEFLQTICIALETSQYSVVRIIFS